MESFLAIIEILGVLAFAYAGVIEARRSGFDFVGVLSVAFVSAFGGGTLRDVLLDRHPLYWIEYWQFLPAIFAFAAFELLLLHRRKDFSSHRALMLMDALGLGLFCASGVAIALEMEVPVLPAALIGVITATFGGVLRDILCTQKPQLFQSTQPIYATCAFAGAWSYILLYHLNFWPQFASVFCIAVTVLLRVFAVRFHWKLRF